MEFSAGGGALRFAPFVVSCRKGSFEAGPSFLLCGETGFGVVYKEIGLVNKMESNTDDLFEAVGSVTGGSVVTASFFFTLSKRDSISLFIL